MAILDFDDARDRITGAVPISSGAASLPGTTAPASLSTLPRQQSTGAAGITEGLPDLNSLIKTSDQRVSDAVSAFDESLGPELRSEDQLRTDVTQSIDDLDPSVARSILERTYEGQDGLEGTDRIRSDLTRARETGLDLARGSGLVAFEQLSSPGLSSGEARFNLDQGDTKDSLLRGGRDVLLGSQSSLARLGQEEERATGAATARREGIEQNKELARGVLGDLQGDLFKDLDQRVEAADLENEQKSAAYLKFLEDPSNSTLAQASGLDVQNSTTAPTVLDINSRRRNLEEHHGDIAHVSPIQRNFGGRGEFQDTVTINGAQYHVDRLREGKFQDVRGNPLPPVEGFLNDPQGLAARIDERQQLFGGDPAYEQTLAPHLIENSGRAPVLGAYPQVEATLRAGTPLPTFADFASFDEGTLASPGNIATDEEIARANLIAEFLGSGSLQDSEYRAAEASFDEQGFDEVVSKILEGNVADRENASEQLNIDRHNQYLAYREARERDQLRSGLLAAAPSTMGLTLLPSALV